MPMVEGDSASDKEGKASSGDATDVAHPEAPSPADQ